LLVSFRGGALDIADGAEVTPSNLAQREYHHPFPRAYLRSHGIPEVEADNALNCSLITWRTNRTISADEPLKYLTERAEAARLGESELRHRLVSDAIPVEPFLANDWEDFLMARAELVADAVKRLCDGVPWSPFHAD